MFTKRLLTVSAPIGVFAKATNIHQSLAAKSGCKNPILVCLRGDGTCEILFQFTATATVANGTVIANVGKLPLTADTTAVVGRLTSAADVMADMQRLTLRPNGDVMLAGTALAKNYTYTGAVLVHE